MTSINLLRSKKIKTTNMKTPTFILLLLLVNTIQADAQVRVPQEENVIVTLDGIPGLQEWDNSLKIPLEENYILYLMADTDSLYLAVFCKNVLPYTDIYVINNEGIANLHASMQLGERLLPEDNSWDDETPAWNWGNNSHWTANTAKYKRGASDSLPFREQLEAYEGQEFRIAISKLGREFSLLVVIRDFVDPEILVSFPVNGNPYDTGSWQTISVD